MRIFQSVGALSVACAAAIASTGCNLDVKNPTVIDAATFNPNTDGTTLALSAQTNFYMAFQSVALFGGLISDEIWTGAARLQTKRLAARVFASTDDINADFFAPLSLAIASNKNAIGALQRYRVADTRLPVDSSRPGATLNGVKYVAQAKFNGYGDPIRLASGLEAQYIAAEAALHGTGSTTAALTVINARRAAGGQGAYAGATDSLSVITELLNQRARDFWLEGKTLR